MSLQGKKGLIVGIANDHSIAYGCADAFHRASAEVAITYLNAKAEPYVRPLAEQLQSPIIVPCDVREPGQLEAVFARIAEMWGRLDFLLHSIAYAPKEDLHSRITDCSQTGFNMAMDVSCHSFISMARMAEPLMKDGGCLLTVTFYGSEKMVEESRSRRRWRVPCAIWRPNSARSASVSTRYRRDRSKRAPCPALTVSPSYWSEPARARRSISLSASMISATSQPFLASDAAAALCPIEIAQGRYRNPDPRHRPRERRRLPSLSASMAPMASRGFCSAAFRTSSSA